MVDESGPHSGLLGGIRDYFRALLSGTEPLHRVIISDMLIGGTLINVVAVAVGLGVLALGVPTWLWLAIHFSPTLYNLFLVFVVWKTSATSDSPWAWPARLLSLVWFGVTFFI